MERERESEGERGGERERGSKENEKQFLRGCLLD